MPWGNKVSLVLKDSLVSRQFSRELEIAAEPMMPHEEMVDLVEMVEMVAEDVMGLMDYRVISLLLAVE